MLIISLAISLFNVLKVNALECLSVLNQKLCLDLTYST